MLQCVGLGGSKAQIRPSMSVFLLPVDLDVGPSATSLTPICLLAALPFTMMTMDQTSELQARLNSMLSFIGVAVVMVSLQSNKTLTKTHGFQKSNLHGKCVPTRPSCLPILKFLMTTICLHLPKTLQTGLTHSWPTT